MKRATDNKEKIKILYSLRHKYYLQPLVDDEDIDEVLLYVKHVKRFFIKLNKNKDININLLVNHLILLFNCFQKEYIIKYLMLYVNDEHITYLKTILLYMHKIELNNKWFRDYPISYNFDYLLHTINKRDL